MPGDILVKQFSEFDKASVNEAGGKGASLGEMTQAGIPVPPGFVVVAAAFDQFLEETDLLVEVNAQMRNVNYEDVASVTEVSKVIRDLIGDAVFPEVLSKTVTKQFQSLGTQCVAVRSSATAEDGTQDSWAGELESYLNTTETTLLDNIKKCWSSLFTPRAIVYRNEKGLIESKVSVAVVVQKMVQSEVSGICFTVHPVTEDPKQMIIEAGWGLGEAIVSGQITPDSYVVNKDTKSIVDVNISEQAMMIVKGDGGSNREVDVPDEVKEQQKIEEAQILELAEICITVEEHYGFPVDIEWAMEDDVFYIVQSRPITTLGK